MFLFLYLNLLNIRQEFFDTKTTIRHKIEKKKWRRKHLFRSVKFPQIQHFAQTQILSNHEFQSGLIILDIITIQRDPITTITTITILG